eukprot:14040399-Alexandrium_andersonii.AAC.1
MSASLVGSEMCIRDRATTIPWDEVLARRGESCCCTRAITPWRSELAVGMSLTVGAPSLGLCREVVR